jgi:hypothetical protein
MIVLRKANFRRNMWQNSHVKIIYYTLCVLFVRIVCAYCLCVSVGRVSSVGIAIGYGLVGLWMKSLWRQTFINRADRSWGPPSLLYNGYRVFAGRRTAKFVALITDRHLPLRLKKE